MLKRVMQVLVKASVHGTRLQAAPRSIEPQSQKFLWRHAATSSSSSISSRPDHVGKIRLAAAVAAKMTGQPEQDLAAHSLDSLLPRTCPGCGVALQSSNPDAPGYYQVSQRLLNWAAAQQAALAEGSSSGSQAEGQALPAAVHPGLPPDDRDAQVLERLLQAGEAEQLQEADELQEEEEDADGAAAAAAPEPPPGVVCARCYSLRHYGHVKSPQAEALLPEFDLNRQVGRKIRLGRFRRAVVLCVVDVADFDGSLPRLALQAMLPGMQEGASRPAGYSMVIAVNKADLLPKMVSLSRLEGWVRQRCKQAGLPPPVAVQAVSSLKSFGIKSLLETLRAQAGSRGDVWVVGAQNAGKSSLINAMRREVGAAEKRDDITTAAQPGTTLDMLLVRGVLPGSCKMFDTPGVPHSFQLSSKLRADEVAMLLPMRQLKPRTFRAAAGQTVLVGGVARLDVLRIPGSTLYLTVWVSDRVPCHYGKTDGADERLKAHGGQELTPPIGRARQAEIGHLVPKEISLEGSSWKQSSVDIAVAGLGWVAVAVSGTAELRVWAPQGIAITRRQAIVPDLAKDLERPGFGNRDRKPKAGTRKS